LNLYRLIAATLLCMVATVPLVAQIPMEGRSVPLQVTSAPAKKVFNQVIKTGENAIQTFDFELASPLEPNGYGLFVPNANDAYVYVNERPLEVDPVLFPNGLSYLIPEGYLVEGANSVRIWRAPEPVDGSVWVGTAVFALTSFEHRHFGAAMAQYITPKDPEKVRKAQLPSADQLKYDVLSYDLYLQPDMVAALNTNSTATKPPTRALSSRITSATVAITAQNVSGAPLTSFVVDFDRNLDQNSTLSPPSPAPITVSRIDRGPDTADLLGSSTFNDPEELITIPLSPAVPAGGTFTVRIGYSGYPSVEYTETYQDIAPPYCGNTHNGVAVVYTASQPYGARRWWPCKDVPEDKANSTIQRINVPTGTKTMSNGVLQSVVAGPDAGTETHTWVNNSPISTYLVTFHASNYVYSDATYTGLNGTTTMPVRHAIYPEQVGNEGNGAAGTVTVINVFRNLFGEYPFLDQKYGTATWNITYGIENQTATGMPAGASAGVGNGFTRRNVHELAHQWWGDSVTYANFDHLWLGEGFATYAEGLWDEFKPGGGPAGMVSHMNGASFKSNAMISPTTALVGPTGDRVLSQPAYERGAWVLHMLRHIVGDTAFFNGLKQYQQTFKHSVTYSSDFEAIMEAASGQNLDNFFQQWLYRTNTAAAPTFPRYAWTGAATESGGVYTVAVNVIQAQGGTIPFDNPVDVRVTASNGQQHTVLIPSNAFSTTTNIVTGTTVPVAIDIDPDSFVLKNTNRVSIRTVGLPNGQQGVAYTQVLSATGGTTPYVWSLGAGAPNWISLVSGTTLSGTPPAAGTYSIPITLTDNSSTQRTTTLQLKVSAAVGIPEVLINEVYYDNYGVTTDSGEYIELYNASGAPADISGWKVMLVDGSTGNAYSPSPITIPAATTLAAGDYYVIGNATTVNAAFPGAVDLNVDLNNILQDGRRGATPGPDAIVLKTAADVRVDSLNYSGSRPFAPSGSESSNALSEGGTGMVVSFALGTANNASLGRLPNGGDTNSNLRDFANIPLSPGSANSGGVTLPFSDTFDSGVNSAWRRSFQGLRTATAGSANVPSVAAPSPAGGSFMEVFDSTGGGDSAYLAGAWNQINFTGYIWIPQDVASNGWATGLGIATRNENGWFSYDSGYEVPNAFYLVYQNGPLGSQALSNGALPTVTGTLRFVAANGTPSLNVGPTSAQFTQLGSSTSVQKNAWNKFRMVFDVPNNKLYAAMNDSVVLYDGAIPSGNYNTSGGVTVGFRENHTGNPPNANVEGTWVDHIAVDTNTAVGSGVEDSFLY